MIIMYSTDSEGLKLNIYMVKRGEEKVLETVSYNHALSVCEHIDKAHGNGSATLWHMNTDKDKTYSRLNRAYGTSIGIHDNSIWR